MAYLRPWRERRRPDETLSPAPGSLLLRTPATGANRHRGDGSRVSDSTLLLIPFFYFVCSHRLHPSTLQYPFCFDSLSVPINCTFHDTIYIRYVVIRCLALCSAYMVRARAAIEMPFGQRQGKHTTKPRSQERPPPITTWHLTERSGLAHTFRQTQLQIYNRRYFQSRQSPLARRLCPDGS